LAIRRPPVPTPFPYTTLFRSLRLAVVVDRDRLAVACALTRGQCGEAGVPLPPESHRPAVLHHAVDLEGHHQVDLHLPRRREHARSEEHTSELQSRFDLVCRLL